MQEPVTQRGRAEQSKTKPVLKVEGGAGSEALKER